MLKQITDSDFNIIVDKKLLVIFTSPWCSGCKKVEPVMEAFSIQHPDISFGIMDISINQSIPARLGVTSLPTIIAFISGSEFERISGEPTKHELERLIRDMVCSKDS